MKLRLERYGYGPKATIGNLSIDGKLFCWTLEDVDRKLEEGGVKIPHETAIPRGQYEVAITWSNRFQKMLPQLMDVPQFAGIRIHPGNTDADTEGCILVGGRPTSDDFIPNSRQTFTALFNKLEAAESAGESISIEVV